MKSRGVARVQSLLASADSMAWSSRARNEWHHEKRRLCGGGASRRLRELPAVGDAVA
jgi:hypothetical protein